MLGKGSYQDAGGCDDIIDAVRGSGLVDAGIDFCANVSIIKAHPNFDDDRKGQEILIRAVDILIKKGYLEINKI